MCGFYEQLFFIMLSLAIVISLQTVGNILVLALLVTPAATARLLTDRLVTMIGLSALLGSLSGLMGLYFSYHFSRGERSQRRPGGDRLLHPRLSLRSRKPGSSRSTSGVVCTSRIQSETSSRSS